MNQSQFAKLIGVSQPRVATYISEGKIEKGVRKIGRNYIINPEVAIKELNVNLDPEMLTQKEIIAMGKSSGTRRGKEVSDKHKKKVVEFAGIGSEAIKASLAGKNLEQQYKTALLKLKYEVETGKYVLKEEMRTKGFAAGLQFKEGSKAMVERLAPILAVEKDPFKIKQALMEEVNRNLENLYEALDVAT